MFILGLDGLEHSFVEEFDCKNLKQLHYSQIDVPLDSKRGIPVTPQVWLSFLSGKWIGDLEFANAPRLLKYPLSVFDGHQPRVNSVIRERLSSMSIP